MGVSGVVERLEDGTVLKSPQPNEDVSIELEGCIYRLLGPHDRLISMLGYSKEGLILEYMEKGPLEEYLTEHPDVAIEQGLRWARQAAEGLQLLHTSGIIHCDTKPRNFLLDANLCLKIADFSGSLVTDWSRIDGYSASSFAGRVWYACESTRSYFPRDWREASTVSTDLFALGSTIYRIFAGTVPYKEQPSHEVERLYRKKLFPDISELLCGDVIRKCWLCQYESAQQVCDAIKICPSD